MFARHRVALALASAQVLACLATIVVTPLHAQTSTTGSAPQVPAAAHSRAEQLLTPANKTMARNLPGHLLLMHGDMDDNVHPANTIQLIDELIKANRTFDLILPNRAHGLNEPYVLRRRWDCFVQYLMGATPPDNYEITRPPDAAGTLGAGSPDDDPSSWR